VPHVDPVLSASFVDGTELNAFAHRSASCRQVYTGRDDTPGALDNRYRVNGPIGSRGRLGGTMLNAVAAHVSLPGGCK
jgi:hypothetical protein